MRARCLIILCGIGSALTPAQAQTFTVLHAFRGGADGAFPTSALVRDTAGNLFGTTTSGGASNNGTVFKVDASGNESVLYSFAGGTDGAFPAGGVFRDSAGNLYGTTDVGGSSNNGTVFKLDTSGKETVLYSFAGSPDGATPTTRPFRDSTGNLYGTTINGGTFGNGTVYKIDIAGKESVLHSFKGGSDGSGPAGGIIRDAAGNLYGTTTNGGGSSNCSEGCGTLFKIDAAGEESVLHSFTGTDGAIPIGTLTRDTSGNFYGTTQNGGAFNNGTVFEITSSGKETVLHSFPAGGQILPEAGVIRDGQGNLYGTTEQGGTSFSGTVFKLTPAGVLTVLHSFSGQQDGDFPVAALVRDAAGNLYGTATDGGDPRCTCGTVFNITPK